MNWMLPLRRDVLLHALVRRDVLLHAVVGRDALLHVICSRLRTCRSMSLRGMSLRRMRSGTHADRCVSIAIRLVISTASSSAAIA